MSERRILNIIFALIVAGCLYGLAVSAATRPEFTIRIAILASPDDEDYAGAMAFKETVEAKTTGRVEVKIYASGQYCGGERECIENMQSGVLDIFMTTFGGFGNFFGAGQVFDLPYVFDDDRIAECVLDGPILTEFGEEVLDKGLGVRLMTIGNTGGWRDFATTSTPIRLPADLKGLKVRTTPAPFEQEFVRELGANPTPIAWSEVYLALATGVVSGTKNSVQDIVSMKLNEHIKHITTDHHAYMGAMWWMSERRWNEMPDDIQRAIEEGFAALKIVTREEPKRRQQEAYAAFEKSGGTLHALTDEEKQRFRKASEGMRAWYVRNYGSEWLEKLDAAVAGCAKS